MPNRPTKGRDQQGPGIEAPPMRFPETPPPPLPSGDYSYVLEIVMNMQLSMGKLTEAVDGLKAKQTEQGNKIDGISHKVYAAIVVLVAIGAIFTFFAKSINDAITNRLLVAPVTQQQPAIPTPTPTPTPTPQKNLR